MKPDSQLAAKIEGKDFIITAEYLPRASISAASIESSAGALRNKVTAVNAADNQYGVAMSSLAASVGLIRAGIEPIYQIVTRDRNRIAIQSDLMGAAYLGIKNVLCLSGYHQTLMGYPQSANVYDIDSIQLIASIRKMNEEGSLLNGTRVEGNFGMLIGAAANPYLKPADLNLLRFSKKISAGAKFIQTQAVFDIDSFQQWLETVRQEGFGEGIAILAGVQPLTSAEEAQKLSDTYSDFVIPDSFLKRLKDAGDLAAQKKEGLAICTETIKKLKGLTGLRGIHLLCGGNESIVPDLITAADL